MNILIKNAQIVNEGEIKSGDVLIKDGKIEQVGSKLEASDVDKIIDAEGKYLMPGVIDDQVHFREPGLTQKANINTESKAAIAGGTTSFMEMPNTVPQALTQELLEDKYQIAKKTSYANYSFYMGASNDNLEEVLKTDPKNVCGVKIFMGSSTGNMLVDDTQVLEEIFKNSDCLIATHCEDEATIKKNLEEQIEKYGDDIPVELHPIIRNEEACYKSSELAVALAKKHNSRLHVFHLSTEEEIVLFDNSVELKDKRITAEICVHHLWFDADDYKTQGTKIKCNPAVKDKRHKKALFQAMLDDKLDVIATDHAPHTLDEKNNVYTKAPSGIPTVQHSLNMMLEFYKQGKISFERIVEKMCHAPAICFNVKDRGFIREGYWADLVLVDLDSKWQVNKDNIEYKCGWSPFEGKDFSTKITHTIVSGNVIYEQGEFGEPGQGMRLEFE